MPSLSHSRTTHRHAFGLPRAGALLLAAGLGLAACATAAPETDAERAAAAAPYPNLNSVPAPPAAMAAEMRRREAGRLAADRERAQSADLALRPPVAAASVPEPTTWGRRVAALRPAGTPPRLAPDQRSDLAQVARLVRGRAGRVRLVYAAGPPGDGAAEAVAAELTALGVPAARLIDQPIRRRAPVPGAGSESPPPPEGEVQIYVD